MRFVCGVDLACIFADTWSANKRKTATILSPLRWRLYQVACAVIGDYFVPFSFLSLFLFCLSFSSSLCFGNEDKVISRNSSKPSRDFDWIYFKEIFAWRSNETHTRLQEMPQAFDRVVWSVGKIYLQHVIRYVTRYTMPVTRYYVQVLGTRVAVNHRRTQSFGGRSLHLDDPEEPREHEDKTNY